jgi:hypothetical protein
VTALDRFRSTLWLCVAGVVAWAAFVTRHGAPWGQTIGIASFGALAFGMSRKRRFFRTAVSRSATGIVCRYAPWYDSGFYLILVVGIFGVSMCASGSDLGVVLGFLALLIPGLSAYFLVAMWRKAVLIVEPSSLSIRLPRRGSKLTEIPRERIESITPKTSYVGGISSNAGLLALTLPGGRNSMNALQVEIVYAPTESVGDTETVLFGMPARRNGMQVCVTSANLLDALVVWKNSTNAEPIALLEQIEGILRGGLAPADSSRTYAGYFSS